MVMLQQKTTKVCVAVAVDTKHLQTEKAIDCLLLVISTAKGNCQPAKSIILKLL